MTIEEIIRGESKNTEFKEALPPKAEKYNELPVEAIREMIVNAHCHRNMTDESCVQVAIYDDRLEVTSPGGLYNGLTFEDMMQGHSKLRNRVIANVFGQMGLVESWGTGIKKIIDSARDYGLPEPEFIEMPETFRVNLFRKQFPAKNKQYDGGNGEKLVRFRESLVKFGEKDKETNQGTEKGTETDIETNQGTEKGIETDEDVEKDMGIDEETQKIIEIIMQNPNVTIKNMSGVVGISVKRVRNILDELRASGYVSREGAQKNGKWVIRP